LQHLFDSTCRQANRAMGTIMVVLPWSASRLPHHVAVAWKIHLCGLSGFPQPAHPASLSRDDNRPRNHKAGVIGNLLRLSMAL
jgi:hypothetical protein